PGSGKTRVITRRIAYLVLECDVHPKSILAVTFTNKAAGEMRQRVWELVPRSKRVDPYGVELPPHRFLRISTFHSFAVHFLRQYGARIGIDRSFTIYDQADRAKLLKATLEAADFDTARITPEAIGGAISRAKNELLTPDRYAGTASDYFSEIVARVYPAYEK